jgi:S-formylglutathione hydrolase
MISLIKTSEFLCFGGRQIRYEHLSTATRTNMPVSVFLPPGSNDRTPVLWFLSGLTCNDQNVVTKGGYQRVAAELGLIVVCPDSSPRGAGIEGEDDDWDFGTGAGFYLDATAEPWSKNYLMETYITKELPTLLLPEIGAVSAPQGNFGHSMGGHGALTLALKYPERYKSISAFSPICAPSKVPWGQKAFGGYLASEAEWAAHDANELIQAGKRCPNILIDQGAADSFLAEQLSPEAFEASCEEAGQGLEVRMHEGYDHSYFFIQTFMEDHLRHHAKTLGVAGL